MLRPDLAFRSGISEHRRVNPRALVALLSFSVLLTLADPRPVSAAGQHARRWSPGKARAWQKRTGWLVGSNYIPAYAVNQLEMWQAETFDAVAIDHELRLAESLGFNSVRVYLHHLLWEQDPGGLLQRMEEFLDIAEAHGIGVMFVLLDGVWDPHPQPGPQPAPRPHIHNSRWVQSPGAEILGDPTRYRELKPYIKGVIRHFRRDRRIHAWDLFNEPDNPNPFYFSVEVPDKAERVHEVLAKAFRWARAARPRQPLTAGVWVGNWSDRTTLRPIEKLMLKNSDVVSFHHYGPLDDLQERVQHLRRYRRPLLCTEWMARTAGSTFDPHLGFFAAEGVAAYNWGFVAGKTQTIYPWESWLIPYTDEPTVWFHDIFRADGSPYDAGEIDYIRSITSPPALP